MPKSWKHASLVEVTQCWGLYVCCVKGWWKLPTFWKIAEIFENDQNLKKSNILENPQNLGKLPNILELVKHVETLPNLGKLTKQWLTNVNLFQNCQHF